MTRLPLMLLLAASLAAANAQAQTAAEQAPSTPSSTASDASDATADAQTPPADGEKQRLSDANCLRETGSRITKRNGKPRCTGQPGRAYTKDDIDRTGYTNLGDALRALDPAIR